MFNLVKFAAVVLAGSALLEAQGPGEHVVQLTPTEVFAESAPHNCWFTQTGMESVSFLCKTSRVVDFTGNSNFIVGQCKSGVVDTIAWKFCRPTDLGPLTWEVTAGPVTQTGTF